MSHKPQILLVGGHGFLGTHLQQALEKDWTVRVYGRSGKAVSGLANHQAQRIESSAELDVAMGGCDAVAYLVYETSSSPYLDTDRLAVARNMELLLLVLESAERCGVGNVLFFSSGGAVYGVPMVKHVLESHPLSPISSYGVAKVSMEMYLHFAARAGKFKTLIIRPSNPFGLGQNPNRKQGVIPIYAQKILKGEPIEIWGDGRAAKDYIHVTDMAAAVSKLVAKGFDNEVYNVGSGTGTTLLEIVDCLEKVTGLSGNISFMPQRANDVSSIVLDTQKIRSSIAWKVEVKLEDGIREVVSCLEDKR